MPYYTFQCSKCNKIYDALAKWDETGKYESVACPQCESKEKTKKVTNFSFAFNQPQGTDLFEGSHDYRFKHNLPKVMAEREAGGKTHMGANPYEHIDDSNVDTGPAK